MNKDDEAYLALLSWYVNASDPELDRLGVTRPDVLRLAREYNSAARNDELAEIGHRLIVAFKVGRGPV